MSDEQFEKLLEKLQAKGESWWTKVINSTLTSLITAVMIGFFAIIWHGVSQQTDTNRQLTEGQIALGVRLDAIQETFNSGIAALKAKDDEQAAEIAKVANGGSGSGPKTNKPVASSDVIDRLDKNKAATQSKIDDYIRSRMSNQSAK